MHRTEHGRVESDSQYKSSWRLYSLIDCMFQSTKTGSAVQTEPQLIEQIESKVRKELPYLPRFTRHDCRTIKFSQNPDGCPFLDGQQTMPPIKSELLVPGTPTQLTFIKNEIKEYDEYDANLKMATTPEYRPPLVPANRVLDQMPNPFDTGSASTGVGRVRIRRRSFMPRSGQITLAQVEALRKENDLLAEQRDNSLKALKLNEQQYLQLEQTFDLWLHQQEVWIAYLEARKMKEQIVRS